MAVALKAYGREIRFSIRRSPQTGSASSLHKSLKVQERGQGSHQRRMSCCPTRPSRIRSSGKQTGRSSKRCQSICGQRCALALVPRSHIMLNIYIGGPRCTNKGGYCACFARWLKGSLSFLSLTLYDFPRAQHYTDPERPSPVLLQKHHRLFERRFCGHWWHRLDGRWRNDRSVYVSPVAQPRAYLYCV